MNRPTNSPELDPRAATRLAATLELGGAVLLDVGIVGLRGEGRALTVGSGSIGRERPSLVRP